MPQGHPRQEPPHQSSPLVACPWRSEICGGCLPPPASRQFCRHHGLNRQAPIARLWPGLITALVSEEPSYVSGHGTGEAPPRTARSTVLRASQCYRVHPRDQDLVAGVVIASRLVRVNAVTVKDVLDGHKLLEIDCVDRVYLSLSVPSLVVGGQMVNFPTVHERNPIPTPRCWSGGSSVPLGARPHRLPAGRKTTPQPRQREKIATAASEGDQAAPELRLEGVGGATHSSERIARLSPVEGEAWDVTYALGRKPSPIVRSS